MRRTSHVNGNQARVNSVNHSMQIQEPAMLLKLTYTNRINNRRKSFFLEFLLSYYPFLC